MYQFSLESHYTSQGTASKPNEDGFFVSPSRFVMIDGATGRAKNGRRFIKDSAYQTDASWLVAQIINYYPDFKGEDDDIRETIRKFGYFLNQLFLKQADLPEDIEKSEIPCAAISIAHQDNTNDTIKIAALADTEAIAVFHDGSFEVLHADPRMDANEKLITAKIKSHIDQHGGTLHDAMYATIGYMRERASTTNTPNNRGVLNVWDTHTAPNECFSNFKAFNAKDIERIIMYSDGIDDRYNLFTHQALINYSKENGFQSLVEKIRKMEKSDPLGVLYPRIKTSDDATIVCATIHEI